MAETADSSDSDLEMACVATIGILSANSRKIKKKRTIWTRQSLLQRNTLGADTTVTDQLRSEPSAFKSFMRMDESLFEALLQKIGPFITRKDTQFREAITAQQRLTVTLRFLISGLTYTDLSAYHKISLSSLSTVIPETCHAIYNTLKEEVLRMTSTQQEWKEEARKFEEQWNLPNCIGAIDGKHITITRPPRTVTEFYNYKGFYSVILLALVSADYKFIFVDIGSSGSVNDSTVFRKSGFSDALEENMIHLPTSTSLTGFQGVLPYYIVGDDVIFPLKTYLLKPYPNRGLSYDKRVYNYRLSRARRVAENAFGILANRFRIFHRPINLSPEKVETVVLATLCLHNYLCINKDRDYLTPNLMDTECVNSHRVLDGTWREDGTCPLRDLARMNGANSSVLAKTVRDNLKDFLNSSHGEVEWQWDIVAQGY